MEQRMADQEPPTSQRLALVGTSSMREADATINAVERPRETLRGFGWCEGTARRRLLDHGVIAASQGTLNVGVRVVDRDQGYDPVHQALPAVTPGLLGMP